MTDPVDGALGVPPFPARLPDAHGEAALLLVESLIHRLIANASLTITAALDVTQTAADSLIEVNGDRGDSGDIRQAHTLLTAIANSLRIDAGQPPEG